MDNNKNNDADDNLDLNPELAGIANERTLDDNPRKRHDEDDEQTFEDALFQDEEALDQALDDIPTLDAAADADNEAEAYEDALFADEAELEAALDGPLTETVDPVVQPGGAGILADTPAPAPDSTVEDDEVFEDVLFLAEGDDTASPVAEASAQTAMHTEPEEDNNAFDDVLFSSPQEPAVAPPLADEAAPEDSGDGEDFELELYFAEDDSEAVGETVEPAVREVTGAMPVADSEEEPALYLADEEENTAVSATSVVSDTAVENSTAAEPSPTEQEAASAEAVGEESEAGPVAEEADQADPYTHTGSMLELLPEGVQQEDESLPAASPNEFTRLRLTTDGLWQVPAWELEDAQTSAVLEEEIIEELDAFAAAETPVAATEPEHQPQNTSAKLKRFFQKGMESLDENLGRNLPDRDIPLEFKFPPQKNAKDNGIDASTFAVKAIFEKKGVSAATLLKKSDAYLMALVRTSVSDDKRQQLLDLFYQLLAPHLQALLQSYQKYSAAPDKPARAEQATHARAVLQYLMSGYKQVYAGLYQATNVIYQHKRQAANQLAHRIMELAVFEKQLSSRLHAIDDPAIIATINRLYYVMGQFEPEALQNAENCLLLQQTLSLQNLYLQFQLLLAFDLGRFAAVDQALLCIYLAAHTEKLLQLQPSQLAVTTDMQKWLIPMAHQSLPQQATDTIQVDTQITVLLAEFLFNQIRRDYAEAVAVLGKADAKVTLAGLDEIDAKRAVKLLSLLNMRVEQLENRKHFPRYTIFNDADWQVHVGLDAIVYFLETLHSDVDNVEMPEEELQKRLLARRQSAKAHWQVAMEDEKQIYAQLEEQEGIADIDVGELVLIKTAATLALCQIRVMRRLLPGKLDIELEKLADNLLHILVDDGNSQQTAILASNAQGHWLITATDFVAWNKQKLAVTLPDGCRYRVTVNALKQLSNRFQMLAIVP